MKTFTKTLTLLAMSLLVISCNRQAESQFSGEIVLSVNYDADTVEIRSKDSLLLNEIITTNWSIGCARAVPVTDSGYYKIWINRLDSVSVLLSRKYPIVSVLKDSIGITVRYDSVPTKRD
jgi:hypothetical protein